MRRLTNVRAPHMTSVTSNNSSTSFGASSALHAILGIATWLPHWQSENLAAKYHKTEVAAAEYKCCEAMSCLQVPSVVIPYQGGIMTSCNADEAVASRLCRVEFLVRNKTM